MSKLFPSTILLAALLFANAANAQNLLSDDGRGDTAVSRTEAERWIQRAVRSSESIKVPSRISHAAAQFARVYARMGNVDAAFEAAKRVENPQLKLYALTATAKAAVDTGQATHAIVDEAKRTLAGNEGAFNNSAMQKLLGIVNQETKDAELVETPAEVLLDELRATFKNASNRNEKFAAFEPLAFRLLKLELIPELELAIQAMVDAINKDPRPNQSSKFGIYGDDAAIARTRGMHLHIAIALADAGKPTEAMDQLGLVDPLIDPLPEAAALVKWQLQDVRIRVLLKLGHEKDAIKHRATIQSPLIASRSAASIAVHMIELGDVNAGLTMAQQIGDENGSGDACGDVAIALLQHADTPIAANYLNEIGDSDDATAGFISVARHWVESENSDRLLSTFNLLESPVAKTHYAIAAAEFLVLTKD